MGKFKIKCKIINVEPDPLHSDRTLVSVELHKGRKKWVQAFSLLDSERPISVEEFMEHLKGQKLEPPTDPFTYLKQAQKQGSEFEIELGVPNIGEVSE